MTDTLDYSKNYSGAPLNIKTNELEAAVIKGDIQATAGSIGTTELADDAVTKAKLDTAEVTVTVLATATSGTATVTAGAQILGVYPAGNQDQFVDNIAIVTTTLTLTLAAAATADNVFKVVLLKA